MNIKEAKILVVDDEKDWVAFIHEILSKQGFRYVDGVADVIRFSDLKDYDVAILDVRMPKYTGFQIKNYLKVNSPNTKIVLISQHEDFGLNILSEANGVDGWIEKRSIMENDLDFIILIEELLKDSISRKADRSLNKIPGDIVFSDLNLVGIKTIEQVKIISTLMSLKKTILSSSVDIKEDLLMDIDQLSIELSKKNKSATYISQVLSKLAIAFGKEEIDLSNEITNAVDKLLLLMAGSKYFDNCSGILKTESNQKEITKIEVNPQINIKSDIHTLQTPDTNADFCNLIKNFSELKGLILEAAPEKKDQMESIDNSIRGLKSEDLSNNFNSKAISKISKFVTQLGDENSELTKILKGIDKGKDIASKFIKSFIKIARYVPIDTIKNIFM